MNVWAVAIIVLLLNIHFGYWRINTKRLSRDWVLAIHIPVALMISIRFFSGLGWEWVTFPALIAAFMTGQYFGGRLHGWWATHWAPATSCLVWDCVRMVRTLADGRTQKKKTSGR